MQHYLRTPFLQKIILKISKNIVNFFFLGGGGTIPFRSSSKMRTLQRPAALQVRRSFAARSDKVLFECSRINTNHSPFSIPLTYLWFSATIKWAVPVIILLNSQSIGSNLNKYQLTCSKGIRSWVCSTCYLYFQNRIRLVAPFIIDIWLV